MKDLFLLDPDVVFLNHGSFGACPRPVFERYQAWQRELEREPVEFIARRLTDLLAEARATLGAYVGAGADELTFVPNATTAVNIAARSLRLRRGDEVLATNLEYGACDLMWEHECAKAGARYVRVPTDELLDHRTDNTRAVYLSHITSETALLLPVERIVSEARPHGLTTIVDGAHAVAQFDLDLTSLGADFYAGNCHKRCGNQTQKRFSRVSRPTARRRPVRAAALPTSRRAECSESPSSTGSRRARVGLG